MDKVANALVKRNGVICAHVRHQEFTMSEVPAATSASKLSWKTLLSQL